MAKPKVGDTRGWNEKTGTGYKWEVKNGKGKWIRYRRNKRQISNTLTIGGNIDVAGGTMSAIGKAARAVVGMPSKEEVDKARAAGERYKTNNAAKKPKPSKPSSTTKPKPSKPSSTTKPKSSKEEKKKVTSTRPKPGSAGSRMQQTLKDSGFTQAGLDKLTDKHAAWKKAKKQGTLGDWEKKYHPDRTPQYTNKNKSTPKPTTQKPEPKKSKLKFSDPLPEKKKKKKKKNNNNPIGKQFGG